MRTRSKDGSNQHQAGSAADSLIVVLRFFLAYFFVTKRPVAASR